MLVVVDKVVMGARATNLFYRGWNLAAELFKKAIIRFTDFHIGRHIL